MEDHREFLKKISDPAYMRSLGDEPPAGIENYRVIELLGKGGMGQVWLAEQDQPVKRNVALKIISAHLVSPKLMARFEAEKQSLAVMNHSNIAKIFDAGTTSDQRPFFAMEFVGGVPLNRFCDENRLSISERLKLFVDICAGVQHAHQRGIIHRDLKPANILVSEDDGTPVPKIIDFGLAKALESELLPTDESLTGIGQILGTLKYMSPEQARLDPSKIDTRSDIYSLGIILYELLTGKTPLDDESIRDEEPVELLKAIRESDPMLPSKKLAGESSDSIAELTQRRQTDRRTLNQVLVGELDWVVMKALEKDPERRYSSVAEFSSDLQNYLEGLPVSARPTSTFYRMRKFAKKNRGLVIAVSLILLSLLAAVAGTSWGLYRANVARKSESKRADAESKAKQEAVDANEKAQKLLVQLQNNNEILASIFEDIDITQVKEGDEPLEVLLGKRLSLAFLLLDEGSAGDPLEVARLQKRLADSLKNVGLNKEAAPLYRKALDVFRESKGNDDDETIDCVMGLAFNLTEVDPQRALDLISPFVAQQKESQRVDELSIRCLSAKATCFTVLRKYDGALLVHQKLLEQKKQVYGESSDPVITSLLSIGQTHVLMSRGQASLDYFKEAIDRIHKIHENDPGRAYEFIAYKISFLSLALDVSNRPGSTTKFPKLLPLMDQCLDYITEQKGDDPATAISYMQSLAQVYEDLGTQQRRSGIIKKGLGLRQRAFGMAQTKFGNLHPKTLRCLTNLGIFHRTFANEGDLDESIKLLKLASTRTEAVYGNNSADYVHRIGELGKAYIFAKRFPEAAECLEEAFEKRDLSRSMPPGLANPLFDVYVQLEAKQKAIELVPKVRSYTLKSIPEQSTQWAGTLYGMGRSLLYLKAYKESETLLRESLAIWEKLKLKPYLWITFDIRSMIGETLAFQEKPSEAIKLLLEGYEGLVKNQTFLSRAERGTKLRNAVRRIISCYKILKEQEEVDRWNAKLEKLK